MAALEPWMVEEQSRWAEYRKVLDAGISDYKNNDYTIKAAQSVDRSINDTIRGAEREQRQLTRYGVPEASNVVEMQRKNDRGLSRALNSTDIMNRAQVQQYDADTQFANQLIGLGHGVGSTANELRSSITSAKQSKDDAYKSAKANEKAADKAEKQAQTQAIMTTTLSILGAVMG